MCAVENAGKATTYFECVSPILPVSDVQASVNYYVNVLGFKVDWQTGGFASVSRGHCRLMLAQGEQGNPGTWVWVGVGDTDLLFQEYCAKGAKIRHPPTNYTWAYEMQVFDLDGNVLRLGSEQKANEPLGEWLDENGVLWKQTSEGNWVRTETAKSS